jgi:hypothetical protein
VAVVCFGLGLGGQAVASFGATIGLVVLWVSYGLIALWWSGRPTRDRDAASASRAGWARGDDSPTRRDKP